MPDGFPYALTAHAAKVISEREISMAWITRVLAHPEKTEPDRDDPTLRHALARIPAYEERVLRVVYNETTEPWLIVNRLFRSYPEEEVMKLHFDEKADAIYLRLDDSKIIESEKISPGIVFDFNEHNQVVGIEILNVKDRVLRADRLDRLQMEGDQ
jgi:uncharacterized protein YuzE